MSSQQTLRRLILAKRIFLKGEESVEEGTEIGRTVALLHFDNSVELVLKTLATEKQVKSISVKRDLDFKDLWNLINNEIKEKMLPLKTEMFNQREARNLVQHQGMVPSLSDIKRHESYTLAFLTQILKDFFNTSINYLYLSSLVKIKPIDDYLLKAEKYVEHKDYSQAVKKCAETFHLLFRQSKVFKGFHLSPRWTEHDFYFVPKPIEFNFTFHQGEYDEIHDSIKKLYEYNKKLYEGMDELHGTITTMEEVIEPIVEDLKSLSIGIDYAKFTKFRSLTPSTKLVKQEADGKGDLKREFLTQPNPQKEYTDAEVNFVLNFVIDVTLKMQELQNFKSLLK